MDYSDEGSLDSPSDHPPMSPNNLLSPDDAPNAIERINGDNTTTNSDTGIKIRRQVNFLITLNELIHIASLISCFVFFSLLFTSFSFFLKFIILIINNK